MPPYVREGSQADLRTDEPMHDSDARGLAQSKADEESLDRETMLRMGVENRPSVQGMAVS